jgi:thiol-disulfide isomerase/thioredoxin
MTTRRRFLTALAAAGGVLTLDGVPSVARANSLRIGAAAPAARLVTLDGEKIPTTDLIGQVVILTFWATWCVPCREELPLLSRYQDEHAAAGLRILAFCLDPPEELAAVRKVAASLSFPVGLLAQSSAPGYGRIWRLPVSFTIDRAGLLVTDGWREKTLAWTRPRLEEIVTPLLATAARSSPPQL